MTATTLAHQRAHAVVDSPVGPLTLVAADGVLTGLYMDMAAAHAATRDLRDRRGGN